ncbi:hypothetical protein LWI29_030656 [Acer saccharum]|uniref:Uncharacterized protein n=1 Tax=Acer saccharum TaxID=4024 RepID=A0AA39SVI4_ACESA|nr:hypothetical protein LWI29_030656 [Acer saccharum]
MLPTSMSKGRSSSSNSRANPMFPQYLRRIIKWQQMDIEYTFWQMLHLCTSPKVVYQHTKYHKHTFLGLVGKRVLVCGEWIGSIIRRWQGWRLCKETVRSWLRRMVVHLVVSS